MSKVQIDKLPIDELCGIIQEFVTRDGTDFTDMIKKAGQVCELLKSGEAIIIYNEEVRNTEIILSKEYTT